MARRRLSRITTTAAVAAAAAAVGFAPSAASAATACATPDLYGHQTVTPASATGGTDVSGAKFGSSVAIGDFNKDGFRDVAIGAPADHVGSVAAGSVTVFNGSASGPGTTGKRLTQSDISSGNEAGDKFGASLAAGDFDKDGYADLAVGIPDEAVGTATGAGAIAVFTGAAAGLTTGTWYGQSLGAGTDEAGDAFGTALATGDLNGDGYVDLAIGSPGEAPSGGTSHSGSGYVYKGSSTGIVRGWGFDQGDSDGANEAGDKFGTALAIGNVTGDSHADLVIGAPGEAPGTDPAGSGAIYVVPGASDGKGTGFARTQGSADGTNEAGDAFGSAVAIGNVDKDSYADVAVGVPGEAPGSNPASGSVVLFPGASTALSTGYSVNEDDAAEAIETGDRFGAGLSTGDIDNDGYADLLIGTPGKSFGTASHAGAAYLFPGGPRQAGSTRSLVFGRRIGQLDVGETNESSDAFGAGVALGDVTGDSKAEGVIGSAGEAPTGQPTSGTAAQLSNLARPAVSVPVESFSPTTAMQATPVAGGSIGTLEYSYTDNIGRLLHGHQVDPDNFSSVQWTVISGGQAYSGEPALAEQADGKLHVAGHNTNGAIGLNIETGVTPPTWGTWAMPAGPMASAPAIAEQADGTLVAFAIDAAGVLWAAPENGTNGGYTSWLSLGVAGLAGTPTAVPVNGGIQVFALTTAGSVATVTYNARALSGCTVLAGSGFTGHLSVVSYPGSKLRVFARAADGSIQTVKQDDTGTFPDTWETVGTFTAAGSPAALLSPSTGKTELVARAADGAVYSTGETIQGSGVWRNWTQVTSDGDLASTDPSVFAYSGANGQSWAFVFRNSDNQSRVYNTDSSGLAGKATGQAAGGAPGFARHALTVPR